MDMSALVSTLTIHDFVSFLGAYFLGGYLACVFGTCVGNTIVKLIEKNKSKSNK